MKVVFIAGPFRAATPWQVEENVRAAERVALDIWRLGAAALCPHTNTRFFDKVLSDDVFLAGTRELLRRCDAMYIIGDWLSSHGTHAELDFARAYDIPVFHDYQALARWLQTMTA